MTAATSSGKFWRKLVLGIPAVLVLLWGIAWICAANLVPRYLESWIARENIAGRNWSCVEKTAAGFPATFNYTCAHPVLNTAIQSGPAKISLREINVSYSPLSPLSAAIRLQGPLKIETAVNPKQINASWDHLNILVSKDLFSPPAANLAAQNIIINITANDEILANSADALRVEILPSKNEKESERLNVSLAISNYVSDALNKILGNNESTQVNASLAMLGTEFLKSGAAPARIKAWRDGNGALDISELKINKGRLAFEATGRLKLDNMLRPEGNLQTRTAGLSSLLERAGLPAAAGLKSGLLGNLFRKPGAAAPAREDSAERFIPMPLILRDGYIWIGPIKTPVVLRPVL